MKFAGIAAAVTIVIILIAAAYWRKKGYIKYAKRDYKDRYDYACGGASDWPQGCHLKATLPQAKKACDADPRCTGFTYLDGYGAWLKSADSAAGGARMDASEADLYRKVGRWTAGK